MANKDSTFAYGSCASMLNLAAKGAPLVSVGVIDAMGTEAVIVRPDAGVKSLGDLKGKTILTTANAGVNTFFPLALKNAGLAESDVQIINVPEGALVSSYLQGAGDTVGMLKLLFHSETRALLGVHVIGEGATELVHIGQAVIAHGGKLDYFIDTVFNYPTLAECYKVAALAALNKFANNGAPVCMAPEH